MLKEFWVGNRTKSIVILIVLCVLLFGTLIVSFQLSGRITNDLRETAYDSLMNSSEIIRQNIDSELQDDITQVGNFGALIESYGFVDVEQHLANLCQVTGFYRAYFADATGVGVDDSGEPFNISDLPVEETALEGKASISTGFVGDTAQEHLIIQAPIYDGETGQTILGALYTEVIATRYYAENAFVFHKGEGRAALFNRLDGDFVIKAPQTDLAYLKTENIFEAVLLSNDDPAVHDDFVALVTSGGKSIVQTEYGDMSAFIAVLPSKTNPDLYIATIISQDALQVEAVSISRLILLMQVILLVGLGALIILGAVMLYRIMKERQARETHQLEMLYKTRSREELATALIKAQEANVAKTNFLSNMSHDIRTPMNAIIGMTTLASQNIGNSDKLKECLTVISSSSHHLLDLINDILEMSKIESGNLRLVNESFALPVALDVVTSIIAPLCAAKDQEFTVELVDIVHEYLIGDRMKLSQVLVNLLNNANKFTPVGGHVKLLVEEFPSTVTDSAAYRISVSDNGIGIDKDKQAMVFDPFVRAGDNTSAKVEGTGLGLSIARNIVQAMGGSLELDSELGVGTTFTATLSFPVQHSLNVAEDYRDLKGKRILVVSDDHSIYRHVRDSLTDIGAYAENAESARQLSDRTSAVHTKTVTYDMALVDWDMARIDGAEAVRVLRQRLGKNLPIIVLTGRSRNEIETPAHRAGASAFLSKPIFQSSLYEKLAEVQKSKQIHQRSEKVLMDRRILLVEDNLMNQTVAKTLLEGVGAAVEVANNGQEGYDMFTASATGYYDAVLMDIQMPVMDGYEATKLIRKCERTDAETVPIVALTADVLTESVKRSAEVGINEHLTKPIEPQNMFETLKRLIDGK